MKTEIGLLIAFVVGVIFKFLHWPGSSVILVTSLSTLALLYFPGAFYFFSDKVLKRQNLILSIISGLFLATIPMGMLFKLQYWPGANRYLLAGAVSAPIILGITLFLKSKAVEALKTYYKNMTMRIATLTILAILLYLTPTAILLRLQYWDDPELARLKMLHYTNPANDQYKQQHDEYLMIQDSLYLQEMLNEKK